METKTLDEYLSNIATLTRDFIDDIHRYRRDEGLGERTKTYSMRDPVVTKRTGKFASNIERETQHFLESAKNPLVMMTSAPGRYALEPQIVAYLKREPLTLDASSLDELTEVLEKEFEDLLMRNKNWRRLKTSTATMYRKRGEQYFPFIRDVFVNGLKTYHPTLYNKLAGITIEK